MNEPHSPPGDTPTGSQATDAGPPPPYRRLYRSRADRKIGGVASGFANYLGVDPTLVRIAFVVLALTGVSVLIYIAGWILIPSHPSDRAEQIHRPVGGTDRQVAVAVGIGSLGLAVAMLSGSWTLLAFALIAGGIWLLSEQSRSDVENETAEYASVSPQSEADGGPVSNPSTPTGYPPPPSWEVAPREPHPPQRITRVVLSLLALLTALAISAAVGDWWDVSGTRMLGIAVVIIGVGVVLGSFTRLGARGLIPLGVLGLIALVPVSAVDGVIEDGVGTATFRPSSIGELDDEYLHGIGDMTVDFSGLDMDGEQRSVSIELGIGELEVILGDDLGGTALLEADVGELEVDLPGSRDDVTTDGVTIEVGPIALPGDRGQLDLDIKLGFGHAQLRSR